MPVNNKAKDVLKIARECWARKLRLTKKDGASAIGQLQSAVAVQDSLKYDEPEDWFFPVREPLGAALLMSSDAAGAEKAFREDLNRRPARSSFLFGLEQALKAQKRDYDEDLSERNLKPRGKAAAHH